MLRKQSDTGTEKKRRGPTQSPTQSAGPDTKRRGPTRKLFAIKHTCNAARLCKLSDAAPVPYTERRGLTHSTAPGPYTERRGPKHSAGPRNRAGARHRAPGPRRCTVGPTRSGGAPKQSAGARHRTPGPNTDRWAFQQKIKFQKNFRWK